MTVDEVCYIWNKYQPPYDLVQPQYFYARDFILSLLHFEKKLALSIANVFLNIHFLPLFSLFLKVSSICNTSSKCWLPKKSANQNIFTQDTLQPFYIPNKNLRSPSQTLSETSTFYYIFSIFHSEWGVPYFK